MDDAVRQLIAERECWQGGSGFLSTTPAKGGGRADRADYVPMKSWRCHTWDTTGGCSNRMCPWRQSHVNRYKLGAQQPRDDRRGADKDRRGDGRGDGREDSRQGDYRADRDAPRRADREGGRQGDGRNGDGKKSVSWGRADGR